jgi:hypothetical protein
MREALRDILPTLFACLVLLDGLFSRRRHAETAKWLSAGMGQAVFSFRLAAHAETEAVAEDGRPLLHARALCDHGAHLAGRRKSPVWSTEVTYLPGSSTAGVPEGRSAALIHAGAPV